MLVIVAILDFSVLSRVLPFATMRVAETERGFRFVAMPPGLI